MSEGDPNKTILVVDDEPEIRKLVAAMAAKTGYSVITADSGEHAMTLFKNHHGAFELLITDVVQAGMSGPMLADRLTALQPDLKVLYMSGFDNTMVVQKYVVERGHALLTKPFTAKEFQAKLNGLLNIKAGVAG
jgi:two-component system cell cycle sensor histidine kinase/response regulator CckA